MTKPKYKIGDRFVSSEYGDLIVMSRCFSDREQDWIYSIECENYDLMLFIVKNQTEIDKLLGENDQT